MGSELGEGLSVVIPCYNERGTVSDLLFAVRDALPAAEVIIVDDCSTDGSGLIIHSLEATLNLKIITQHTNSGKGKAVCTGLSAATRPWVVIQDADMEYDPMDLRLMLDLVSVSRQAIYGSRFIRSGYVANGRRLNYYGVKVLAFWAWMLYGRLLSDPHTCYKMIRRDLIQDLNLESSGFELCAEINAKLLASNLDIEEVAIGYIPRGFLAGKKIKLSDFFVALWTYFRFRRWKKHSSNSLPQNNRTRVSEDDDAELA